MVLGAHHGSLNGGIRSADHVDVLILVGCCLGSRSTVIDARTLELPVAGDVEAPDSHARGDDQRSTCELGAIGEVDSFERSRDVDPIDFCGGDELCPEPLRLSYGPTCEVCSTDALGKPEVVLNTVAGSRLTTWRFSLDHHCGETLRSSVYRCGESCGSASDNDEVIEGRFGERVDANGLSQDRLVRVDEYRIVLKQDNGQLSASVGRCGRQ